MLFVVMLVSLFALAIALAPLLYRMPEKYYGWSGVCQSGLAQWRHLFGIGASTISVPEFASEMLNLIVLLWVAFTACLLAARKACSSKPRWLLPSIGILLTVLAVFVPPALSGDIYAYLGYGRMHGIYGVNPYYHGISALVNHNDPEIRLVMEKHYYTDPLYWTGPTYYGPLWTLICSAIAKILQNAPLWAPIMGLKLLQGAGVLIMASAAGKIAGRLNPAWETTAILAVALNPMVLMEGPGMGHLDMLTMAFFMLSLDAYLGGRHGRAGVFIGIATAIKLFPIAMGIWIAARLGFRDRSLAGFIRFSAGCVIPIVLSYAVFWHGLRTFASLGHGVGAYMHSPLPSLTLYALLSIWVLMRKEPDTLLRAWPPFAVVLALWNPAVSFPWYLTWALAPVFAIWDRRQGYFIIIVFAALVLLTLCAYRPALPFAGATQ